MSIYFQFPAIDDYPNPIFSIKYEDKKKLSIIEDDDLTVDEVEELKNYLTFKQL